MDSIAQLLSFLTTPASTRDKGRTDDVAGTDFEMLFQWADQALVDSDTTGSGLGPGQASWLDNDSQPEVSTGSLPLPMTAYSGDRVGQDHDLAAREALPPLPLLETMGTSLVDPSLLQMRAPTGSETSTPWAPPVETIAPILSGPSMSVTSGMVPALASPEAPVPTAVRPHAVSNQATIHRPGNPVRAIVSDLSGPGPRAPVEGSGPPALPPTVVPAALSETQNADPRQYPDLGSNAVQAAPLASPSVLFSGDQGTVLQQGNRTPLAPRAENGAADAPLIITLPQRAAVSGIASNLPHQAGQSATFASNHPVSEGSPAAPADRPMIVPFARTASDATPGQFQTTDSITTTTNALPKPVDRPAASSLTRHGPFPSRTEKTGSDVPKTPDLSAGTVTAPRAGAVQSTALYARPEQPMMTAPVSERPAETAAPAPQKPAIPHPVATGPVPAVLSPPEPAKAALPLSDTAVIRSASPPLSPLSKPEASGRIAPVPADPLSVPETSLPIPVQAEFRSGGLGPGPATHSPRPDPVPTQLAQQIAAMPAMTDRDAPLELTLDPPELGSIRISVSRGAEGMVLHLQAEQPETLELLRRHGGALMQELQRHGLDHAGFSFSGRDQGGQQQKPGAAPVIMAEDNAQTHPTRTPHPTHSEAGKSGQSGLDIRL